MWPPCRYCSRAASNARVRSAGVLTRSQLISKALPAVFPSFSVSIFAVQPASAFSLRCGLRHRPCILRFSPGCRIGTA
ncbi:DUF1472 domain-containing protein [Salmonella enterica]|nr:DUF1472 domain-containing protein [Salmonella enterica]EGL4528389.1 DUF1472 domain-containing protein [Salmonella enterica]